MLRSLFSGISGLRSHQQMMDVTGNNIANVNTVGFKLSQTVFEDTLSQLVRGAEAPRADFGGLNPSQIGLGVRVSTITTNFVQGSAQGTGRTSDLMISGDGFFVVRDGDQMFYTRAGSFSFNSEGRMCNPNGLIVQGWPEVNGIVDTNVTPRDISLPVGAALQPVATTSITIAGNLPADEDTATTPVTQSITTYDPQGNKVVVTATWRKPDPAVTTAWEVVLSDGIAPPDTHTVTFAADGSTPNPDSLTFAANTGNITIDISDVSTYAGSSTIAAQSQNGSAMGSLSGYIISQDGLVLGTFTNGLKQPLGQIALATFSNPTGLEKAGQTMFKDTVNSGLAQLGQPTAGGRGSLVSGSLEMSNVDLGQEFTTLIVAQRGFQANSKIISTSDELLQELVNMKR